MMPDSPVYVLVVEDDFLSRLHAVNLVEDAGYIAVEAEAKPRPDILYFIA